MRSCPTGAWVPHGEVIGQILTAEPRWPSIVSCQRCRGRGRRRTSAFRTESCLAIDRASTRWPRPRPTEARSSACSWRSRGIRVRGAAGSPHVRVPECSSQRWRSPMVSTKALMRTRTDRERGECPDAERGNAGERDHDDGRLACDSCRVDPRPGGLRPRGVERRRRFIAFGVRLRRGPWRR